MKKDFSKILKSIINKELSEIPVKSKLEINGSNHIYVCDQDILDSESSKEFYNSNKFKLISACISNKKNNYFYITGKKLINSNNLIDLHKIYVDKDCYNNNFYEVNNEVKIKISKDLSLYGKLVLNNKNKNFSIYNFKKISD